MRTLKKSLALVLALVMVLGLGVVGASADNKLDDYTDAKDIGEAYVEAVGVMTGLEIVDGMTETTIDPTATYTREQAAKIIAYMVLGKSAADSLTCTVAPFDDVAADRWSAGYISFCVEQGIIDGMTDTTFEPTGTLTGFQWAKMLLSAVGFNAKGEFTGDSWSLNTARVAHSVGLFSGDAAGADHVALQRQQAMLYAFNTLTSVGCVVYSEALGDYIYNYNDFFWDRYTYEGTLGWNVFGLDYVYGVIRDNEGMGNKTTELVNVTDSDGKQPSGSVNVAADTSIDMMWHAVKVWYTGDKTKTGVYTMDLAKTVTAECSDVAKKDYPGDNFTPYTTLRTVGEGNSRYEQVIVDNRAYENANVDGYIVNYMYDMGKLGTRSESADTTVVVGKGAIDNDMIMTDIADIDRGDDIIYLYTNHGAYYIYAVSSTSGAVRSVSDQGTITLTDGTVLTPSVFCNNVRAIVAELEKVLIGTDHSTPSYSFVLDTHGHYIAMSNTAFQTVAYYTGAYAADSEHGVWSPDVKWVAQFVDVATGEIERIPVTTDWKNKNQAGGYYDITDELYGDSIYAPEKVSAADNVYGGKYVIVDSLEVTNGQFKLNYTENGVTKTALFNSATVQYYIATGSGSSLNVEDPVGNAALLDLFSEKYDSLPVTKVVLDNVAAVLTNGGNNTIATTIFAWDGADTVIGGVAFFPEDVTHWTAIDNNYYTVMAYLNGESTQKALNLKGAWKDIEAGFYNYIIDDSTGCATLDRLSTQEFVYQLSNLKTDGTNYWMVNAAGGYVPVASECVVVDTRDAKDKVDSIDELYDFIYGNYNEEPEVNVEIAYFTNSNGEIDLIYVVDGDIYTFAVKADSTKEGIKVSAPEEISELTKNVTVTLTKADGGTFGFANYTVTVNGKEVSGNSVVKSADAKTLTVTFDREIGNAYNNGTFTYTITEVAGA